MATPEDKLKLDQLVMETFYADLLKDAKVGRQMDDLQGEYQSSKKKKRKLDVQLTMPDWSPSNLVPGQLPGNAYVWTVPYLGNEPFQPWARKDQLKKAEPIKDGIGKHLLMKMGWVPGQGLGKNNEGPVDPVAMDIKMDKKGLVAEDEKTRNLPLQLTNIGQIEKNPVSLLYEMCTKKKWKAPLFEVVFEDGPPHRKNFVYKVIVNGVDYQPSISCPNKKQAKAMASVVCLQAFGLLPENSAS